MSTRNGLLLVTLGALWGASFLFIRVAAPVLGPLALIDARVLLAAGALLWYASLTRQRVALLPRARGLLLLGAVNAALPFTLIATATLHLTASLAAILNATTPLFTAIVAAVWLGDRLTRRKVVGMLLALLGVGLVVGWSPLAVDRDVLASVGLSLLAALCYAVGGVLAKVGFGDTPPLTLAVGQQLGAGLLLLPLAAAYPPDGWPTPPVGFAVLALALLSTALGYLIYFRLLAATGPTNTLSVTFLVPVFGVLWGALVLGEPIGFGGLVGLVVVLAGVLLLTGARLPMRGGSRVGSA